MGSVGPGTAISEDFNHQSTLSSRRSKFNVFGVDEYLLRLRLADPTVPTLFDLVQT
jgi:hypothetical protein